MSNPTCMVSAVRYLRPKTIERIPILPRIIQMTAQVLTPLLLISMMPKVIAQILRARKISEKRMVRVITRANAPVSAARDGR